MGSDLLNLRGRGAPGARPELPADVMAAATHSALDQDLYSTLHAVPPVPCFPLLLGLAVDHRMSSFKSSVSVL